MPDLCSALAGTLNNMAMIDIEARRFTEARDELLRAIEMQRKALAASPRNPQYRQFLKNHYKNFVRTCDGLNDRDGAAHAQRQLAEVQATDPANEVLDARLAEVAGGQVANDNKERLVLAQRAYDTRRFALAARLWGEALESDPKLGDDHQAQHRYNAACAAALAASGQDKDKPEPDNGTCEKLRAQALGWLEAERATWSTLLESANPQQRAAIGEVLQHWQVDGDLKSVRDPDALTELPEPEREAWQKLWTDVEALREKAR